MKLLLTSGGIANTSIRDALVDLIGKPMESSTALLIPTAEYGHPWLTPQHAWRFITGAALASQAEPGWKSLGVLELTALPSIGAERWERWVREADVLLVDGGDALYLAHWMRESGLARLLPELDIVWCSVSGGSMAMAPLVGREFIGWPPPDGKDAGLGLVDFAIFPHLDHPAMPENTMAHAERWAAGLGIPIPAYAIDDETALRVVDGKVDVVSEGRWRRFDA